MPSSARPSGWVTPVHLTETCDADRPHLITQVTTMPAPSADSAMTAPIRASARAQGAVARAADRGHGLCGCGRVGAQSVPGSGPCGPCAAQYGGHAGSLCAGPVYHSLGRAPGDLSCGKSQWDLATDPGRAREPDHEGDLSYQRLPPVPASWRLHTCRASGANGTPPGGMASPAGGAEASGHGGVQAAVRHSSGH